MNFLSLNVLQNALGFALNQNNVALYIGTVRVLRGNIFEDVAILDCKVTEDSQITTHPVESGSKISEHQIFNPVEIDMQLVMPSFLYEAVIRELKLYYYAGVKFRIVTKEGTYKNMVLQSKPAEMKPENVDRIVYSLHFIEEIEVQPKYITLSVSQVSNPENSSTVKLGENTNKKSTSILKSGFNALGGLL